MRSSQNLVEWHRRHASSRVDLVRGAEFECPVVQGVLRKMTVWCRIGSQLSLSLSLTGRGELGVTALTHGTTTYVIGMKQMIPPLIHAQDTRQHYIYARRCDHVSHLVQQGVPAGQVEEIDWVRRVPQDHLPAVLAVELPPLGCGLRVNINPSPYSHNNGAVTLLTSERLLYPTLLRIHRGQGGLVWH